MTIEHDIPSDGVDEQQEKVVRHFASRLREMAVEDGPRIAKGDGTHRAYNILNECAIELARLTRHGDGGSTDAGTH